ncbi:PilX N-terminal domain-containing pilus assembly protein [Pseudoxanthomonas mexicana]|uniref:pilus assembly PilX family protein n=1 Tax=Pseudoxanthomonas mexicana TaxID=128785 RepID=UPI00398AC47A
MLYIALIVLILLALIGIAGMQVTSLQEKMSANYRNANLAFQAAEAEVRLRECFLEGMVNRNGNCAAGAATIEEICNNGFDATTWAQAMAMNTPIENRISLRSIGPCISGNSSLDEGVRPVSEDPNPVYQVTIYATNNAANADAAVDTIFRP